MTNYDWTLIGKECKAERMKLGLTQQYIADLLGCGEKKVRKFEKGKTVSDQVNFWNNYKQYLAGLRLQADMFKDSSLEEKANNTNENNKDCNADLKDSDKLFDIEMLLYDESRELFKLIPENLRSEFKQKSFIAGGCIYSLYNNLIVKDYDFFVTDKELAELLPIYFSALGNIVTVENGIKMGTYQGHKLVITDNAITIGEYQIITKWVGTPEEVVSQFDFKHLMFYFDYKKCAIKTLSHFKYLDDKRLHYNEDRARDVVGSIMRANKFVERGMTIYPEEMAKILLKLKDVGFSDGEVQLLNNNIHNSKKRLADMSDNEDDSNYGYACASSEEVSSSNFAEVSTY